MPNQITDFIKEKKWKNMKKSDWVAIALAGVLILIIAMPISQKKTEEKNIQITTETEPAVSKGSSDGTQEYADYLEEKLERILSKMDGVGEVEVMITLSDSGESIVEKDNNSQFNSVTETDSDGGTRATTEKEDTSTTVYVESGSDTYPYVGKEVLPCVEGVLVVAEGGGNSIVISNISDTVMALFPVEAHKIKVVKMEITD